jgi:hypothetical protein
MKLNKTIETINMFLKRLSAALVTITCLGWAALGAAPETLTTATNTGKENSALAPLAFPITNDTICFNGTPNGVFKVSYSGTKTVQTYSILNAAGTTTIAGPFNVSGNTFLTSNHLLGAGTYTIRINFSDGTFDTSQGTIFKADVPLSVTAVATNPVVRGILVLLS